MVSGQATSVPKLKEVVLSKAVLSAASAKDGQSWRQRRGTTQGDGSSENGLRLTRGALREIR